MEKSSVNLTYVLLVITPFGVSIGMLPITILAARQAQASANSLENKTR